MVIRELWLELGEMWFGYGWLIKKLFRGLIGRFSKLEGRFINI